MVTINQKLNFVVPIENDDGSIVYVHSTPLMRETFERYFRVIARAFSEIYSQGLNFTSGPRVAALMIKQIALDLGVWSGPQGVEQGLIGEIRRLSNVVTSNGKGWSYIPLEDALNQNLINEEDASEVENAICFFIVASAMHKKTELRSVLETVSKLWGAQVTSSNITEFVAGLPTLIETANTGEKMIPSFIPV